MYKNGGEGMLPLINLDDEFYDEIYEKAKKMIPGIYPEWTDYNEHDPGITFLQLLSWMKEMQQFHLDQIGKEHLVMFLKLLGGKQQEKIPAKTVVQFSELTQTCYLPEGSVCMAGNIPFETIRGEVLQQAHLVSCSVVTDGKEKRMSGEMLASGRKIKCYPFGEEPKEGACFGLYFDRPLEPETSGTIYIDILDAYTVKRNPIDDTFFPLAEVELCYYGEQGLQPCVQVQDETHGFLQSGIITYTIPAPMAAMEDGTYGICFCLKRSEYDEVPVVQAIQTNVIQVQQTNTLADYTDISFPVNETGIYEFSTTRKCFTEGRITVYEKKAEDFWKISEEEVQIIRQEQNLLLRISHKETIGERVAFRIVGSNHALLKFGQYEMTGFPYQEIKLHDIELVPDCFEIMVESQEGVWEVWSQEENFHTATPESKSYCLDSEKGIVKFGDCEQGMAPEGKLQIIRYKQSLGVRGNVRKGQIQTLIYPDVCIKVNNREDISNGRDKEGIDACFTRMRKEFQTVYRAITAQDYETLVRQTPGLRIQKVKTVPAEFLKKQDGSFAENSVAVVVQPSSYKKRAKLTDAYLKNLRKQLESRRLIGTKVQILSPEYIGVTVSVDLIVKSHYPNAHALIEETIRYYFEHNGSNFGALLEESELYGLLDEKDYVLQVRNLSMHAQGKGVQMTINGNIKLPVNGLSYLKDIDCMIMAGQE